MDSIVCHHHVHIILNILESLPSAFVNNISMTKPRWKMFLRDFATRLQFVRIHRLEKNANIFGMHAKMAIDYCTVCTWCTGTHTFVAKAMKMIKSSPIYDLASFSPFPFSFSYFLTRIIFN